MPIGQFGIGGCDSSGCEFLFLATSLLGPEELVLEPAARVRAGGRVEEDAERDAGHEQRHVAAGVGLLALGALARLPELLDGSLQLVLNVLVARDLWLLGAGAAAVGAFPNYALT